MPIRLSGLAYIATVKKCADILRIMKKLSTQSKKIEVGILAVQLWNLRPHPPSIRLDGGESLASRA